MTSYNIEIVIQGKCNVSTTFPFPHPQVRDMGSGQLLENGRVTWSDGGDQIAPDFLMFHPDDSSRVIHVRTQEIR
ncbi:hypothetical protein E2C01_087348 [Portunus trituberculatus]|uniref:Uncharacterized protein n=1 Tax=Portunus trituberculatus TaxID=210409 RepID=A0A5B7JBM6_PORTR|nr:hypothetical protein [Portunus trituberculatus]